MRTIGDYIRRLTRRWWLVALTILIAGAATGLTDLLVAPSYTATTQLTLRPAPRLPPATDLTRLMDNIRNAYVVNTLVTAMDQDVTREQGAALAGLPISVADDYAVHVDVDSATQTITIETVGHHADRAAAYANGLVAAITQTTTRLYRLIAVQVLQPATPPIAPSRPNMPQDVPLAAGLGLVLGLLLAAFYEYMAR